MFHNRDKPCSTFWESFDYLIANFLIADCGTCYDDIFAAVTDCILSFDDWLVCVEDILGAGSPCIECVCEVINDISAIFGLDWTC